MLTGWRSPQRKPPLSPQPPPPDRPGRHQDLAIAPRGQSEGAHAHRAGHPQLDTASAQRQIPGRTSRDVQFENSRLDHLLQPLLSDAIASDPHQDRRLCHSVGPPQIQADGAPTQRRERLARPAAPDEAETLRPLATMSWQRPNIGSRVNREVHARFWEQPEAQFLRLTRLDRWLCRTNRRHAPA